MGRNDVPRSLGVRSTPALLFLRADRPPDAPPVDLSAVDSRKALMEGVLAHASHRLERPVDTAELARLAALLPKLGAEASRLVAQNERLETELDALRAKLKLAEGRAAEGRAEGRAFEGRAGGRVGGRVSPSAG